MISVVVPARNAASGLADCLACLRVARGSGLIEEVIVVDGGSTDATPAIAQTHGAVLLRSPPGRGRQMHVGALQARGAWLLFLHGDVMLEEGWEAEAQDFLARYGAAAETAAVFRFALRDDSRRARWLERLVAWRCRRLGLAYGDQGLLVARSFYHALGGFEPLELMEDVEMIRRIGRRRLMLLRSRARSDARRYRREGFVARGMRNGILVSLYLLGVSAHRLARFYEGRG